MHILHVKWIHIFGSRLSSAVSHVSFSTAPAVNKKMLQSMWVLCPTPTGVSEPFYHAQPADHLLRALLRRGKVMGLRVALSCWENDLQVFGVAPEQGLTASVLKLSEQSCWQVKSCLLSTANDLLSWLSPAVQQRSRSGAVSHLHLCILWYSLWREYIEPQSKPSAGQLQWHEDVLRHGGVSCASGSGRGGTVPFCLIG